MIISTKIAHKIDENDAFYIYYPDVYVDPASIRVVLNDETKQCIDRYSYDYDIIYYNTFNGSSSQLTTGPVDGVYKLEEGTLLYKDSSNRFNRYYMVKISRKKMVNTEYIVGSGNIPKNFVVKVTVTLYPKA